MQGDERQGTAGEQDVNSPGPEGGTPLARGVGGSPNPRSFKRAPSIHFAPVFSGADVKASGENSGKILAGTKAILERDFSHRDGCGFLELARGVFQTALVQKL